MEEIKTYMVNPRGRVVAVEQHQLRELAEKGWRIIQNPKEDYYPQYDQSRAKPKSEESDERTQIVEVDAKDHLGLIVI